MDMAEKDNSHVSLKPWVSVLQICVPVFLFVLGVYIHQVDTGIHGVKEDMNKQFDMIFKHMTNDELHAPRSIVVTKPEFSIYQELRAEQVKELRDCICRIEAKLNKIK